MNRPTTSDQTTAQAADSVVVKTPAITPTTTISTASMPQIALPKALMVPIRLKRPVVGMFIFLA